MNTISVMSFENYQHFSFFDNVSLAGVARIWMSSNYNVNKNELYDLRNIDVAERIDVQELDRLFQQSLDIFSDNDHTYVSVLVDSVSNYSLLAELLQRVGFTNSKIRCFHDLDRAVAWVSTSK